MADVEFRFSNFKSFREARLPLAPLTVMIGANASGKSNAIEGIEMLSWLAQGRRLGDLFGAIRERELRLRGAHSEFVRDGSKEPSFGLGFKRYPEHRAPLDFEIRLGLKPDGLRVVTETLVDHYEYSTVPLYQVVSEATEFGSEVRVAYNNFARGGKKPQLTCNDSQALFTQLTTPARFESELAGQRIPAACSTLSKWLSQVLLLDADPRQMREYSFQSDRTLRGDGSNLSAVLFHLASEAGQREALLRFVRSLPEQNIKDLGFIKTPRGEVMVKLSESFGSNTRWADAPSLSDGTLRVLAVAAALLSVPEDSIVIIEELDNGVHPSRARELLANIDRTIRERKLRVLLTTHNPALLDALPDRALPDVVACYRDPEQGDSRLVRLGDLNRYPELVAQGSLGELVTRGILDRTLKTSDEARQERDLAWLSELRAARG